nr:hypothetical protein [Arenimonas sp.]
FPNVSIDSIGDRPEGVENGFSANRKKLPARTPISPNCADFFPRPNPEMKKSATLPVADFWFSAPSAELA